MAVLQNLTTVLRLESSQYSQGMARAIVATKTFDRSIHAAARSSGALIGGVSRSAEGLALITGTAGAAAIKMAIDFESAFTGVLKTVEGTDDQLNSLRTGILDMSEELPATANEIAGVAEQAGQLGIEAPNVLEFTRVMIDMGESTNLSANDAAQSLARFFNIMETGPQYFDNLGSAIVDLGNNFATTESEITDISLRLAGAGRIVGLVESEILALATAASSIGIAPERAGTALQRTLVEINTAVQGGGERLEKFATVAGTSASDFASTWRDEPREAILDFLSGLRVLAEGGGDVSATLDDLDLRGIRVQQTLQGLASAGDLTGRAFERSASAWDANTALATEAGRRYETAESQLRAFGNTLRRELIDVGTERLPVLLALLEENADELPKLLGDMADAGLNLFESLSGGIPLLEALATIVAAVPPDLVAWGISMGFVARVTRGLVGPLNLVIGGMARFPALGAQTRLMWAGVAASVHGASTAMTTAATKMQATERVFRGTSLEGLYGAQRAAALQANRAAGLTAAGFTPGLAPPPANSKLIQQRIAQNRALGSSAGAAGVQARGAGISFGALTLAMTGGVVAFTEYNQGLQTSARKTREAEAAFKDYGRAVTDVLSEGESPLGATGPAFDFEGFPDLETDFDLDINIFKEWGEAISAVKGEYQLTADVIQQSGSTVREFNELALRGGQEWDEAVQRYGQESGIFGRLNSNAAGYARLLPQIGIGEALGFFDLPEDDLANYQRSADEFAVNARKTAIAALAELEAQGTITAGTIQLLERSTGELVNTSSDFTTIYQELIPKLVEFNEAVGPGLKELGIDQRFATALTDLSIDFQTGQVDAQKFLRTAREFSDIEGIESIGLPDSAIQALTAAVGAAPDQATALEKARRIIGTASDRPFDAEQFQRGLEDIGGASGRAALGVEKWNEEYTIAVELGRQPSTPNLGLEETTRLLAESATASQISGEASAKAATDMAQMGFTALGVKASLEAMADADAEFGKTTFDTLTVIQQSNLSYALLEGSMDDVAAAANALGLEEQQLVDVTAFLQEEIANLTDAFWQVTPGVESAMTYLRNQLTEQYNQLGDEAKEGLSLDDYVVDRSSLSGYLEGLKGVQGGQLEARDFARDIEELRARSQDDLAVALLKLATTDREAAFRFANDAVEIGKEGAQAYENIIEEIDVGESILAQLFESEAAALADTDNQLFSNLQLPGQTAARDRMVDIWGEGEADIIAGFERVADAAEGNLSDDPAARAVQNVLATQGTSIPELAAELEITANPDIDYSNLRQTPDGRVLIQAVLEAAEFSPTRVDEIITNLDDQEFATTISQALFDLGLLTRDQHQVIVSYVPDARFPELVATVHDLTSDKKVRIDYVLDFQSANQAERQDQQFDQGIRQGSIRQREGSELTQNLNLISDLGPSPQGLDLLQKQRRLAEGLPSIVQEAMLEAAGYADEDIVALLDGDPTKLEFALDVAWGGLREYDESEADADLGAEVDEASVEAALADVSAMAAQATVSVPIYATLSEQAKKFFAENTFVAGSATLQAELNRAKAPADGGLLDFYAKGGMRDQPHVAQIAPAGTWRVWAEPETGGEAYIPLSTNKRSRSEKILSRVADMFGYGLVSAADEERKKRYRNFADGGILTAPIRRVSNFSHVVHSGTTVSETHINQQPQFLGDMVMTDPKAAVEYAQRQTRKNALIGLS